MRKIVCGEKVVSIEALDSARTTYEAGLADIRLAVVQVLQAKATLGSLQKQI